MTASFFRAAQYGLIAIQSQTRGRVRFRVPSLKENPLLRQSIEWALSRQIGVCAYSVSALTGSVLVRHRNTLRVSDLMATLTGILRAYPQFHSCRLGYPWPATVSERTENIHL